MPTIICEEERGGVFPEKLHFISEPYPVIGSPFDDPFFKAKAKNLQPESFFVLQIARFAY
jgi:hypothetical protein